MSIATRTGVELMHTWH